ncbi:sugar ABC transporter permease [Spirochaetia bacterium]|nr:sugar ABC transporter permease [Spirochaetia bacterium]
MSKKVKNKIRDGNIVASVIMYILAAFVIFITLYPFYYVFILSVSEPHHALTMDVYTVPKGFNLGAYQVIIRDAKMWRALFNTIMYVVTITGLMLITSVLGAFPLTYKGLKGRKIINTYLLFTMFFSGGLIPTFLLILKLKMYNSPLALIIPGCFSVWYIILVKSYFSNIPETLREAAKIDGANVYQILFRVYVPLSVPIIAVIAVYSIVNTWNSWFSAMVYLPSVEWQPLQLFLRRILVESQPPSGVLSSDAAKEMVARRLAYSQLKYAIIIFSSLPVIFTYPFFQKYFMKGVMLGSLKERHGREN